MQVSLCDEMLSFLDDGFAQQMVIKVCGLVHQFGLDSSIWQNIPFCRDIVGTLRLSPADLGFWRLLDEGVIFGF